MKKILCVLRTSTLQQEIESQKQDMLSFLLSKGYQEEEIEWLVSKGASARKASKAYLQMLEQIKSICLTSDTIKSCAVWHLNRLGRIGKYLDEMKNWFIDNHIQLYVKTPEITLLNKDGSYNMGNTIVFGVLSTTIPSETEETMGKLERGKNYLRDQGLWVGELLNYGFTHTKDRHIVVDEAKMANVFTIYSEYATGNYSYYTLALEMTSRGVEANEKLIQRIINNDKLYEPYISTELIERVKQVKKANTTCKTTEKHSHLATKILRCQCGAAFTSTGKRYRCLHSSCAYRYKTDGKGHPSIYMKVIDFLLWDIAKHLHRGYLVVNNAESAEELNKQKAIILQKLNHLNAEIDKQTNKINKAKELYLDGDFTKSEYQHRKSEIEAVIDGINKNIDYFNSQLTLIDSQLVALNNPSYLEQLRLEVSVGNIVEAERQREIVRQHIKYGTIAFTEFNNHKATLIVIEDKYNHTYKFIYDFNCMKTPNFIEKLYIVNSDGSTTPFGTGDQDEYYRKAYQTALALEMNAAQEIRGTI